MLLAIDLGNSNITLGVFSEQSLLQSHRLESRRERTVDEYAIALRQALTLGGPEPREVTRAIIASVVPSLTVVLVAAVRLAFGCETLVVSPGIELGISISVERPAEVGTDRLVNAVAVRELMLEEATARQPGAVLKRGAIVVDLGTATKFDCLSPAGEFMGGVIAPGLGVSFDALVTRAAKLPTVALVAPPKVMGRNTVECLQSGIVHGYASLIDGLVSKLRAELPFECDVVATGGLAWVVAEHAQSMKRIEPHLTLRGLYILAARNTGRQPNAPPPRLG